MSVAWNHVFFTSRVREMLPTYEESEFAYDADTDGDTDTDEEEGPHIMEIDDGDDEVIDYDPEGDYESAEDDALTFEPGKPWTAIPNAKEFVPGQFWLSQEAAAQAATAGAPAAAAEPKEDQKAGDAAAGAKEAAPTPDAAAASPEDQQSRYEVRAPDEEKAPGKNFEDVADFSEKDYYGGLEPNTEDYGKTGDEDDFGTNYDDLGKKGPETNPGAHLEEYGTTFEGLGTKGGELTHGKNFEASADFGKKGVYGGIEPNTEDCGKKGGGDDFGTNLEDLQGAGANLGERFEDFGQKADETNLGTNFENLGTKSDEPGTEGHGKKGDEANSGENFEDHGKQGEGKTGDYGGVEPSTEDFGKKGDESNLEKGFEKKGGDGKAFESSGEQLEGHGQKGRFRVLLVFVLSCLSAAGTGEKGTEDYFGAFFEGFEEKDFADFPRQGDYGGVELKGDEDYEDLGKKGAAANTGARYEVLRTTFEGFAKKGDEFTHGNSSEDFSKFSEKGDYGGFEQKAKRYEVKAPEPEKAPSPRTWSVPERAPRAR